MLDSELKWLTGAMSSTVDTVKGMIILRIRVDASSIMPGRSAGIEAYTYGLLNGLAANDRQDCAIDVTIIRDTGDQWRRQVPGAPFTWSEVAVPLSTESRLGRGLRRLLPVPAQQTALVSRATRALRNRANPVRDDVDLTLYPFQGVPARASRSVIVLHDLRQFQPGIGLPVRQALIRENVGRAAAVIASWPHPYRQVLATFPEAASKTVMVPLPVFHPRPTGVPTGFDPTLLLYPSSTGPYKNHRPLLEAMALLPELRLVCPGPLVEPQASALLARAAQPDLRGRVHFPGFVPVEELTALFARAAAVVVPSVWEAASGAIFEAFSWGLPVACADVEPLRAQLEFSAGEACLFAPTSPNSIAGSVRQLLADRDRYTAASLRAGRRLATRTWAQTARDYEAVFEWVAGGRPGPIPQSPFATQATLP